MIIDVHTHLWDSPDQLGPAAARRVRGAATEPWAPLDASGGALIGAMGPVDAAFVLGIESKLIGASVGAKQVADFVNKDRTRFFGFAGIDPMQAGFIERIDEAIELGLVGIAISPAGQGFHPTHSDAMRLYEYCTEKKLPIIFDAGLDLSSQSRMEFAQPYLIDEVALNYPELRMIITQMGRPFHEQTLALISKHDHVYTDIAGVANRPWELYNLLISAKQLDVMDRLLLASNFPHASPESVITHVYSVNGMAQSTHLPTVPREQLRSIIERDALACMGITKPEGMATDQPHEKMTSPSPSITIVEERVN